MALLSLAEERADKDAGSECFVNTKGMIGKGGRSGIGSTARSIRYFDSAATGREEQRAEQAMK